MINMAVGPLGQQGVGSVGTYLSIAHATSPYVTTYKRAGDVLTKLADPATLPTGTGYGASWSG